MKNLNEIIDFRHTVKAYDETKKVDEAKLKEILEFTR